MPCNSKNEDMEDAKLVAQTFQVPILEIDISQSYNLIENDINYQLNSKNIDQLTYESKLNIKPRLRMLTLYAVAQTYQYLVIGTGNLSENMVGYTTKWGDSSSDFNPIGNFTVEEVLKIGEYLGVPEEILKKSPSDGLGEFTDEEKMGIKYIQISEYIETGKTDETAMQKIEKRYLASVHKRNKIPVYKVDRKNYLEESLSNKNN